MTGTLRLTPWAGDASGIAAADAGYAAELIAILTEHPRPARWGCYLASVGGDVVGVGAFKAAPDAEGTVELAYGTFPAFGNRGDLAREGGAATVIAHTLRERNASARALARNRFAMLEEVMDPEDGPVWYWERVLA